MSSTLGAANSAEAFEAKSSRSSRSVREDVLMCSPALSFTPLVGKKQTLRPKHAQLRHVLQHRKEPLTLTLKLDKGPGGDEMAALLADITAASRPVHMPGGIPAWCATCMHALHGGMVHAVTLMRVRFGPVVPSLCAPACISSHAIHNICLYLIQIDMCQRRL